MTGTRTLSEMLVEMRERGFFVELYNSDEAWFCTIRGGGRAKVTADADTPEAAVEAAEGELS